MEEDQERLLHSRSPGARKSALSLLIRVHWRSLAVLFRRKGGDDFFEARIAAKRVPEGVHLEVSVVCARTFGDSGLNDGAQLLDREIFLARPGRGHGKIGAYNWSIERVL